MVYYCVMLEKGSVEKEVDCEFRQPAAKHGFITALDGPKEEFLMGGSSFPSIQVFGLTGRACELLVAKGSDFCVCPSLGYDYKTCPFGKNAHPDVKK